MPRTLVTAAVLAVVTLSIYAAGLRDAPIYLSPDEVTIAVDAHALASTGHDVDGSLLPLYFHIRIPGDSREGWFTPAIFYFSALFLKVLPLSESAVRLPTACVGMIDVVLMYFLGRRIFKSEMLATFAAGALALTPGHFILSRYALDYLYPVPFILAWLLCLANFIEREKPLMLFAATAFLGLGFFSYIAAVVMMPLYLLFTAVVLFQNRKPASLYGVAAAGFALPLVPLLPWLLAHPAAMADTVQRYAFYDPGKLNALQGLRSFLSYPHIDEMVSLYWSFFNPSFLFLTGDHHMMFSTRSVGVFALAVAVLVIAGIRQALTVRRSPLGLIVLLGFVTGPLAAVLVPEAGALNRAVEIIPFSILLATFGLERLWDSQSFRLPRPLLVGAGAAAVGIGIVYAAWTMITRSRVSGSTALLILVGVALVIGGIASERMKLGRITAACLIVAIPIQFATFCLDYFTDYRLRAAPWLGGNLRGALEFLIDRDRHEPAPRVYFSTLRATSGLADIRNRWMDSYWKFYLIKHGRGDLLERTARFDPAALQAMPPRSLVLANIGDVTMDGLVRSGELKKVKAIPEVDNAEFFVVLQR